jgi:hypothetical protein
MSTLRLIGDLTSQFPEPIRPNRPAPGHSLQRYEAILTRGLTFDRDTERNCRAIRLVAARSPGRIKYRPDALADLNADQQDRTVADVFDLRLALSPTQRKRADAR